MDEIKHTPGPWKLSAPEDGYVYVSGVGHSMFAHVVWCMDDDDRSPHCEANAHLIAAAPDMFAALSNLLEAVIDGRPSKSKEIDRASVALARARGEG